MAVAARRALLAPEAQPHAMRKEVAVTACFLTVFACVGWAWTFGTWDRPADHPKNQQLLWEQGVQSHSSPHVKVVCGTVTGAWERGVAAFRGIPYGAPPLGKRRWKPAEVATCWDEGTALDASRDGPICLQGSGGGPGQSEDCLNLNVFVPDAQFSNASAKPLPVFVWIFGGMNVIGSVKSYGQIENIVRRQRCVLVAMNYRLGIFGFLALQELARVDPRGISGNAGISDQQLALHWVQQNIAAFGGDPGCVTIFGQSSGGTNVLAHLASASSRGLFHKAISLSGSPNISMDRTTKEEQDRRLILPRTPCAGLHGGVLLECLYTAEAKILAQALPESYALFDTLYDYPTNHLGIGARVSALPYVDGSTITLPLQDALSQGLNDVPVLLQSMQAEMACAPAPELRNLTEEKLTEFLEDKFAPAYGSKVAGRIDVMYQRYRPPEYAVYAVDADTAAACGLRSLARAAGKGFRSPVYWGTVTAGPSRAVEGLRFPYHGWDFIAASGTFGFYHPSQHDLAFGARLLGDWLELGMHGRLTDLTSWRPVQSSLPEVAGSVIGSGETRWVADHKAEVCAFWESLGVDMRWWWIN